jgi:hypothetical protein
MVVSAYVSLYSNNRPPSTISDVSKQQGSKQARMNTHVPICPPVPMLMEENAVHPHKVPQKEW